MISLRLIVPLFAAAVAGVAATAMHRRLPSRLAAPLLAATVAAVTFAVAPAIVVVAMGYLAHLPWLSGAFAWCRDALGIHTPIPGWLGLPAVGLLGVAVVRVGMVVTSWRFFRRATSRGDVIVPSAALFAYTLPGPGRQVVVSSGLVEYLTPAELEVVLAHERAHADHRHDRYVLTADLANAFVPLVRPLRRRLLFTLERWADEAAVSHADGDRAMVARTLARVALAGGTVPAGALGVVGLGVGGRVDALLDPPVLGRPGPWIFVMVAGVALVGAAGAVQLHHLLPVLIALCPA